MNPPPKSSAVLVLLALGGLAAIDASAGESSAPASPSASTPPAAPERAEPFAFADFGWLNGNSRQRDFPLDGKIFTGQFSVDANYTYSFARPKDHTLIGSTTSGRTGELQLSDLAIGGDFHYKNVRGRVMTQFGLYSTMQPRNDASPSRGQWSLADAYRYLSEAYGGYHWNALNGINLDVGIFMSYIGLCSYYDFENWVYQESYVSANTPWFFNGARLQIFPSDKFKAEIWLINGWQSYGTFNEIPGLGAQFLWRPTHWLSFVSNEYFGADTLGTPGRYRVHDDTSLQIKYYDDPSAPISRAAFSLTVDAGCEFGGGAAGDSAPKVSCFGGDASAPAQYFVGFMLYNRLWFAENRFAVTLGGGGGAIKSPGDNFVAWDASVTFDVLVSELATLRWEGNHREANVPYFAGRSGITPQGGNQGAAGSAVTGFTPDLQKYENRMALVLMVRL